MFNHGTFICEYFGGVLYTLEENRSSYTYDNEVGKYLYVIDVHIVASHLINWVHFYVIDIAYVVSTTGSQGPKKVLEVCSV